MPSQQNSFVCTERLSIQFITPDDASFFLELVNTEGWLKFIGDRQVHSIQESITYINNLIKKENFYYWTVKLKDHDVPIGIISLLKRDYLDHFDLGFAFLPQHSGKGYAYESANAVLTFLMNEKMHQVILGTTIPENMNSIRLLKKLKFSFLKEIVHESMILHIYVTCAPAPNDQHDTRTV